MASVFKRQTQKLKGEKTLTGTVSVANNTKNLVGVGTLFTTELAVGAGLWINGKLFTIDTITSNTVATLIETVTPAVVAGTTAIVTNTVIYTSPGATLSIVHSLFISNVNASDSRKFIIRVFNSDTSEWVVLANKIEIPVENTYSHPKPINLQSNDKFHIAADGGTDFDVHVYASIVQKT